MAGLQIRGKQNALLVFVDIVDSSKFSAVLDYEQYAERILEFQEVFQYLGNRYFPEPPDKTQGYVSVGSRGDEGNIFAIDDQGKAPDLILRATEFIFHLKGYLKLTTKDETEVKPRAPLQIGLGAGIHYGCVAYATEIRQNRSEISRLEGFSINYAKRVESASRAGNCSRVMLSRDAVRLLEGAPLVFSQHNVSMKGIDERAEVFEIRGGLFHGLKLDLTDSRDEKMISRVCQLVGDPSDIDEPWMKSLIISILEVLIKENPVRERREFWQKMQHDLAWYSCVENDPILLYARAHILGERSEYTQQLKYLREITQKHPDFIHAKKRMVTTCCKLANRKEETREIIYARDTAAEFLERFPDLLDDNEKKQFKKIVENVSKKTKLKRRLNKKSTSTA